MGVSGSAMEYLLTNPSYISRSSIYTLLPVLFALFILIRSYLTDPIPVDTPLIGQRSKFEPLFWVRLRFFTDGQAMISEGYRRFKNSRFSLVRNDAHFMVLSNKYVDEVRSLPIHVLSPTQANVDILGGEYTKSNILLESNLHSRMLQTKLTPNIGGFMPALQDELENAMTHQFPDCKGGWTPVQIYPIVLDIVARMSARIFVGHPLCRNKDWLHASIHYTENVFATVITMRLYPQFMHPIISFFSPPAWRVSRNLRLAQKLIVPMVIERQKSTAVEKPNDLLQWMIDGATEDEGQPQKLAHRELLMTLAAVHTSTMSVTHILYDLCAYAEYIQPLREEMQEAINESGGGWTKTTLNNMQKLDSFLKESQRVSPPSLLAFNRIALEPVTLSDGLHLPRGTRFSMCCADILNDSTVTSNPQTFDGFRAYRQRQKPGGSARHQFATTSTDNLHFGHGKYACPGRFFASNEIKIILTYILLKYDIKFPPGQTRPKNLVAHEYMFPDPGGVVEFQERVDTP